MSTLHITINGKPYEAESGQTILNVCRANGIEIPTLCHDDRLKPFGSCLLCRIEVKGARGTMLACGTEITEGMEITTETDAVNEARKMCVELLLSQHYGDCKAPCSLTCPANIDIQGYIAHIANGQYEEALKLIKERNPLPVVCGRVCTRPCEDACRRNLVDERVGIDYLKRFVADLDLESKVPYLPEKKAPTGRKAAIIGAGPAGLSCAWYLAAAGHEVTVFEKWPHAGGMLRYGIPAYRMPRETLDKEVALIERLGVKFVYNTTFGKDITAESLKAMGYDAIFLGVGSQLGQSTDFEVDALCVRNIISGVEFLGRVGSGEAIDFKGKSIMVIGGGNTAIDAARTALRLGADEVTLIYRRSRDEMPAHKAEVEDAEFEGVKLGLLSAPKKMCVLGQRATVELVRMELGEPDASGRRRPVEVPGSGYEIPVDILIAAIGQTQDLSFVNDTFNLATKNNRIVVDEDIMTTSVDGVFAGGDVVTGPKTAIMAIAAGRRAAMAMNQYLRGEKPERPVVHYNHTKGEKLSDVDITEFQQHEKLPKQAMPVLSKEARTHNFREVELGFTEEQALAEAKRCLSCGCKDVSECRLRDYATRFKANQYSLSGEITHHPIDDSHPYLLRDKNKCIMCGRCVRICLEVQGVGALGFMSRGYNTTVEPSFGKPFGEEPNCIRCGQCVSTCPVGALTEKVPLAKEGPFTEKVTDSICTYCGAGCTIELRTSGNLLVRTTSDTAKGINRGNLCEKGRFRNAYLNDPSRLRTPLVRKNGELVEATLQEALSAAAEGLRRSPAAVYISGRASNEEAEKLSAIAAGLNTELTLSFGIDPIAASFFRLYSQLMVSGYEEIGNRDLFVILDRDIFTKKSNVPVMIRVAKRNKVPVIMTDALTQEVLSAVSAAKAPLIVFSAAPDVVQLEKAVQACKSQAGAKILVPAGKCNARGVGKYLNLDCCAQGPASVPSKALLIYGEDPVGCGNQNAEKLIKDSDFTVVFDLFLTETAGLADVVIPMTAQAENNGSFTSMFGNVQPFHRALETGEENLTVLKALLEKLGSSPAATEPACAALVAALDRTPFSADILEARLTNK